MNYLVDTNILTRLVEPGHQMFEQTTKAIDLLIDQGSTLHIVPQNLYEFWVVCTRPANVNGLGKTMSEAEAELSRVKFLFSLIHDTPDVLTTWEQLVTSIPVVGKKAHDARLVASMRVHGLSRILTLNAKDFRVYDGIFARTPADVLAAS